MTGAISETDVGLAVLERHSRLGLQVSIGPDIAPDMAIAERDDRGRVVLDRPQFRPRRTDLILLGETLAVTLRKIG